MSAISKHMLKKLGMIASNRSLSLAFWEDGIYDPVARRAFSKELVFPNTEVYSFVWQTVWQWWGGDRAFSAANDGYKVRLTRCLFAFAQLRRCCHYHYCCCKYFPLVTP